MKNRPFYDRYNPDEIEFHKNRLLAKEMHEKETPLARKHEIMYILLDVIKNQDIKTSIGVQIGGNTFRSFTPVRNFITMDILTKLLLTDNYPFSPSMLRSLCHNADKTFNVMFWEVCCENEFPMGREYLIDRFNSNKTIYPQFARWYDKKYNLDIKLKDTPRDMALDLLGWK
jgi:hypothetical protein